MADNKKLVHCNGCYRSCEITAQELKVSSKYGVRTKYFPKIGTSVITGYTSSSGKGINIEFAYPVDAIVFAQEVLCRRCDKAR